MICAGRSTFELQQLFDENRARSLRNIAVLPTGSVEQHGPRLPLETDLVIAKATATELDRREEGRLFVFPEVAYSNTASGDGFLGNISISNDLFRQTLREILRSLKEQGFDLVCLVNGHGPNQPSLMEVAFEHTNGSIRAREEFGVMVLSAPSFFSALAKKFELDPPGKHADWFETLIFEGAGGTLRDSAQPTKDPFNVKVTPPQTIIGIPIGNRSDRGVMGPSTNARATDSLRTGLWQAYCEAVHQTFRNDLDLFFAGLGKLKERP